MAAELRTLAGKAHKGEFSGADDKTLTLRTDSGPVAVSLADVLQLDLVPPGELPPLAKDPFLDVELTDGSLLHCRSFALKGKHAELQLLAGPKVEVPLAAIAYILNDAQDAKVCQTWQGFLAKKGTRDLVAIKSSNGLLNPLEGTLGEGDDKGEAIAFELTSGRKVQLKLARVHGLSFLRKSNPDAPAVLCKVMDLHRDVLTASKMSLGADGLTVTTVAGATVVLPVPALARLDFSKGKLTFLSDLEPFPVKETSTEDRIDHYRRDKNLDNGPLTMAGKEYAKGLALHAYTELVYDIGGDYKEFKAVLGVDDLVGIEGQVRVTIEGDGKELFAALIKRKDAPRPVTVDIKGVRKLRVEARSAELLDLGNHVDLADAKVSK
jgi:hypothetical protein